MCWHSLDPNPNPNPNPLHSLETKVKRHLCSIDLRTFFGCHVIWETMLQWKSHVSPLFDGTSFHISLPHTSWKENCETNIFRLFCRKNYLTCQLHFGILSVNRNNAFVAPRPKATPLCKVPKQRLRLSTFCCFSFSFYRYFRLWLDCKLPSCVTPLPDSSQNRAGMGTLCGWCNFIRVAKKLLGFFITKPLIYPQVLTFWGHIIVFIDSLFHSKSHSIFLLNGDWGG